MYKRRNTGDTIIQFLCSANKDFSLATALRKPGIHRLLILRTKLRLGFVSLQELHVIRG